MDTRREKKTLQAPSRVVLAHPLAFRACADRPIQRHEKERLLDEHDSTPGQSSSIQERQRQPAREPHSQEIRETEVTEDRSDYRQSTQPIDRTKLQPDIRLVQQPARVQPLDQQQHDSNNSQYRSQQAEVTLPTSVVHHASSPSLQATLPVQRESHEVSWFRELWTSLCHLIHLISKPLVILSFLLVVICTLIARVGKVDALPNMVGERTILECHGASQDLSEARNMVKSVERHLAQDTLVGFDTTFSMVFASEREWAKYTLAALPKLALSVKSAIHEQGNAMVISDLAEILAQWKQHDETIATTSDKLEATARSFQWELGRVTAQIQRLEEENKGLINNLRPQHRSPAKENLLNELVARDTTLRTILTKLQSASELHAIHNGWLGDIGECLDSLATDLRGSVLGTVNVDYTLTARFEDLIKYWVRADGETQMTFELWFAALPTL